LAGKRNSGEAFYLDVNFLVACLLLFAALILKYLIHFIQNFLTDNFDSTEANYLYIWFIGSGNLFGGFVCP
jgi:CIC family chloride channel protein